MKINLEWLIKNMIILNVEKPDDFYYFDSKNIKFY